MKKTIRELLALLPFSHTVHNAEDRLDEVINHVTIDSRTAIKGSLFIPLPGANVDGHTFVAPSFDKGVTASFWKKGTEDMPANAVIIEVEDPETALQQLSKAYRDSLSLKVVAITGSNGKTTTKDMIASVLGVKAKVQKTKGNYNNHLGVPLTLLDLEEDTDISIVEMGMSARGEIRFLTKLASPDFAVVTNIGESHMQELGSRHGISEAKLEIAEGLDASGTLFLCGDEPLLTRHLDEPRVYATKTFGRSTSNDLYSTAEEMKTTGTSFHVNGYEGKFQMPVLGQHNVSNALAAISIAKELGYTESEIQEGLAAIELTPMRMQLVNGKRGVTILNDAYNASATSMKAAIAFLAAFPLENGRKIAVLADALELGDQEKEMHLDVGRSIPMDEVDMVVTFGELGAWIAKGAAEQASECVHHFADKAAAQSFLEETVESGDFLLIKGSRGMKVEETIQFLL